MRVVRERGVIAYRRGSVSPCDRPTETLRSRKALRSVAAYDVGEPSGGMSVRGRGHPKALGGRRPASDYDRLGQLD